MNFHGYEDPSPLSSLSPLQSKFIAMMLVSSAQAVTRAFVQAYGQALQNARKQGMTAETLKEVSVTHPPP